MPHIRTCSYELQLNWSFGETSLPSFSMMWTTRELAMTALQNELHTRTTLDHRWTYTRLENRSNLKGGHGDAIHKKLGGCDTPKINASVEGKNWGSTHIWVYPSTMWTISLFYDLNNASTRWSHVCLISICNVAFAKLFAQMIRLWAQFPNHPIKTIYLDNADEFTSQTLINYYMSARINIEHPITHTLIHKMV